MVLQEWAQVWNLHETCRGWHLNRKLLKSSKVCTYWYLWAAIVVYFIVCFIWSFVSISWGNWFGLWFVSLVFIPFARDKALVKEFAVECEKYQLANYTFYTRQFYLRYALFLHGLAEQQRSSEEIGKLASFAETAGEPEPFNPFQHPLIPYLLGLITAMLIRLIPTPNSPEAFGQELGLLFVPVGALFSLLFALGIEAIPKNKRAEIKRFLEWAKLDIEEEKANIPLEVS